MDTQTYQEILDTIVHWRTDIEDKKLGILAELIPSIAHNAEKQKDRSRLSSNQFNLFDFFNPGETTHSRILAFFLNPQAVHGQGQLFLQVFLKEIDIPNPKEGRWTVTAEKGRIDVLLKRQHPHSVVIIENKSNFAQDQSGQIYRYWYQEIYQKQKQKCVPSHEMINPSKEKFKIIYLSPAPWKQPIQGSLSRPASWVNVENLPETVPIEPEQRLFSVFVAEWLAKSLLEIPSDNHRLREFTQQYIEYWLNA